jgi:hypothetical protein
LVVSRRAFRLAIRAEIDRVLRKIKKHKKVKREFSKAHVIFADSLVGFVYVTNFLLSLFDKIPLSDLSVAIVTVYGGFATGSYFALCGARDTSLNKHRLRIVSDSDGNLSKEVVPDFGTEGGAVG